MNILTIESSCDETAAAVIKDGREILSSVIATSSSMHEKWGGIVPEVAAREQLSSILPVITEALQQFTKETEKLRDQDIKKIIENHIDAIAVTIGPGLIGSLLIGVEAAKTIAFITGKPLIPVNHVLAHTYANFVHRSSFIGHSKNNYITKIKNSELRTKNCEPIMFPAISLVASGGHTELFLMKNEKELQWLGGTGDDAAGEAFDKAARLLGFGSKGGAAIQKMAKKFVVGSSSFIVKLPRPLINENSLNFSFSGLKTAIMREVNKLKTSGQWNDEIINQFAFEVQEAITDVLVIKTLKAGQLHDAKSILISGGVAANERLREKFLLSTNFFCPPTELCTDNAAMIGSYAYFRGIPVDWHRVKAVPDLSVEVNKCAPTW